MFFINPTTNLQDWKKNIVQPSDENNSHQMKKKKKKGLTIQSSQFHQINIAYNPTVQKVETALVLLQLNAWHFGQNVLKPPSHPYKIEDMVKIPMILFQKLNIYFIKNKM